MTRPETLDRKFANKLPNTALDFLKNLLSVEAKYRPSCTQCLQHPYLAGIAGDPIPSLLPAPVNSSERPPPTPPAAQPASQPLATMAQAAATQKMRATALEETRPAGAATQHGSDESDTESTASTATTAFQQQRAAEARWQQKKKMSDKVSLRGSGRRDISEMHAAAAAAQAAAAATGAITIGGAGNAGGGGLGVARAGSLEQDDQRVTSAASSRLGTPLGATQASLGGRAAAASDAMGAQDQRARAGGGGGSSSSVVSKNQSPDRYSAATRQQQNPSLVIGGAKGRSHLSPPHGTQGNYHAMDGAYMLGSGPARGAQQLMYNNAAAARGGGVGNRAPSRGDPWGDAGSMQRGGGGQQRPTTQQSAMMGFGAASIYGNSSSQGMPPLPPGRRIHQHAEEEHGGGYAGSSFGSSVRSQGGRNAGGHDAGGGDRPATRTGGSSTASSQQGSYGYHLGPQAYGVARQRNY